MKYKILEKRSSEFILFKQIKESKRSYVHIFFIYLIYTGLGELIYFLKNQSYSGLRLYYNFPIFIIFMLINILILSKEILIIDKKNIILKNFFWIFCFKKVVIKKENIDKVYWNNRNEISHFFFPIELSQNLKIGVKYEEYKYKEFSFGVNLSYIDYLKIIENFDDELKEKVYKIIDN